MKQVRAGIYIALMFCMPLLFAGCLEFEGLSVSLNFNKNIATVIYYGLGSDGKEETEIEDDFQDLIKTINDLSSDKTGTVLSAKLYQEGNKLDGKTVFRFTEAFLTAESLREYQLEVDETGYFISLPESYQDVVKGNGEIIQEGSKKKMKWSKTTKNIQYEMRRPAGFKDEKKITNLLPRWRNWISQKQTVGIKSNSKATRKPNDFEIAYNAIAPDYQSLELCNKIGSDAVVTTWTSWRKYSEHSLRAECYFGIAVASAKTEYCKNIEPLITLIADDGNYTMPKCLEKLKDRDEQYEVKNRRFDGKRIFNEIGFAGENLMSFCNWYKKALDDYVPASIETLRDNISKKEQANRWAKAKYEFRQCRSNNPNRESCDKIYNEAYYGKKYCSICSFDCDQNQYHDQWVYEHLYAFIVRNEDRLPLVYPELSRDALLERIKKLPSY